MLEMKDRKVMVLVWLVGQGPRDTLVLAEKADISPQTRGRESRGMEHH